MRGVWASLRDRLSLLDSSSTMVEVTPAYATHFIDMYVDKHTGKHLTGDRVRILLLTLHFLPRDLIAPEVCKICTLKSNIFDYSKWYHILYIQWYIKCYIWWYYRKWYHLLYRKWYSSWQFCYRSTCKTFYGHTGWGITLRRRTWDVNIYLTLWEEHMISYIITMISVGWYTISLLWYHAMMSFKVYMISCHHDIIHPDPWYHGNISMISCPWYHIMTLWYHMTMISCFLTYDIVWQNLWYHIYDIIDIWYHVTCYMISYNVTHDIMVPYLWYHIICSMIS